MRIRAGYCKVLVPKVRGSYNLRPFSALVNLVTIELQIKQLMHGSFMLQLGKVTMVTKGIKKVIIGAASALLPWA